MAEKKIGEVTHWYDKINVAVLKLSASLKSGDRIKVRRGKEEFETTVASMQINHQQIVSAKPGDEAAIQLPQKAQPGAEVYLVE